MAKTKRRPDGDGMVRKRSDGYWEGRIVVGHRMDGLPIYKSVFAKTQKALIPKLEQLKRDYADAELTEDCRMPLGDWLDLWLSEYSPNLRPSTIQNYTHHIARIKSCLGQKQISRVTRIDVQTMYNDLQKSLSNSSVRAVHMMLHEALDAAVRRHLIVANPTEGIKLPKKEYAAIQILNNEQLDRFMTAIREEPDWHDLFYVEITTGLRREDFDEDSGKLTVRRSVSYEHGSLLIGEPKTAAGTRTILLPPSTANLLRKRLSSRQSDWIFPCFDDPELPVKPQSAYNALKRILKKTDLPNLKFHSLRHTFAELCLESGMDIKTLSATLGHESVSTALNVYTHVNDSMREQAAAKIDRRVAHGGDCNGGQPETGTDTEAPSKSAEPPAFAPYKGKIRRRGTGCVSRIGNHLWEGRYSSRNPDGTRACHTVYAKSEEECEGLLAEMIEKVKGERKQPPMS